MSFRNEYKLIETLICNTEGSFWLCIPSWCICMVHAEGRTCFCIYVQALGDFHCIFCRCYLLWWYYLPCKVGFVAFEFFFPWLFSIEQLFFLLTKRVWCFFWREKMMFLLFVLFLNIFSYEILQNSWYCQHDNVVQVDWSNYNCNWIL